MPGKIKGETVKKVAEIARLSLTEKELSKISGDLESILEAFRKIEKVSTENVKPTFQPVEVKNVVRKDKVEKSLTQKEALANAKNKEQGYFKGPKVV